MGAMPIGAPGWPELACRCSSAFHTEARVAVAEKRKELRDDGIERSEAERIAGVSETDVTRCD